MKTPTIRQMTRPFAMVTPMICHVISYFLILLMAVGQTYSQTDPDSFDCFYSRCSYKADYCEEVLGECAPCAGICRENQHASMDQLCNMKCSRYLEIRQAEKDAQARAMTTEEPLPEITEMNVSIGELKDKPDWPNTEQLIIWIPTAIGILVLIVVGFVAVYLVKRYTCWGKPVRPQRRVAETHNAGTEPPPAPHTSRTNSAESTPRVIYWSPGPDGNGAGLESRQPLLDTEQNMEQNTEQNTEQKLDLQGEAAGSYTVTQGGKPVARPASSAHEGGTPQTSGPNSLEHHATVHVQPNLQTQTQAQAGQSQPQGDNLYQAGAQNSTASQTVLQLSELPGPNSGRVDEWVGDIPDDVSDLKRHDNILERDIHTANHPSEFQSLNQQPTFQPSSDLDLRSRLDSDSVSNAGNTPARANTAHRPRHLSSGNG